MELSQSHRAFIIENCGTKTDTEIATELGVDLNLVKEFIVSINSVVSEIKDKSTSIVFNLLTDVDITCIVTIGNNDKDLIAEGLVNFLDNCKTGQITNIIMESVKRGASIDNRYGYIYNRIAEFLKFSNDEEEVISPLAVFNKSIL